MLLALSACSGGGGGGGGGGAASAGCVSTATVVCTHWVVSHYAAQLAELFAYHDTIARYPKGTEENKKAWTEATPIYDAASKHASSLDTTRPHSRQAP